MHSAAYQLRNVKKKRAKGGASFTLEVPELTIHQGEFTALVGPSGCGKSTLLDMLALVLRPTHWESFSIYSDKYWTYRALQVPELKENEAAVIRRRDIGYILQNGGLLSFLTVQENILLTATISGKTVSSRKFKALVDSLGLGDQLTKKPQHLSGGQRQRVAVARALIHRPAIVLADEPTAAVDYPTALDIRDEIRSLALEVGSAVIMVTHDYSLVQGITDQEVRFEVSRISQEDTIATTMTGKPDATACNY